MNIPIKDIIPKVKANAMEKNESKWRTVTFDCVDSIIWISSLLTDIIAIVIEVVLTSTTKQ